MGTLIVILLVSTVVLSAPLFIFVRTWKRRTLTIGGTGLALGALAAYVAAQGDPEGADAAYSLWFAIPVGVIAAGCLITAYVCFLMWRSE